MYSRGQGMIEYGLIIALVAIVVIAALVYLVDRSLLYCSVRVVVICREGTSMDKSSSQSGVEDVLRPVEEILEGLDNTMLIAAWNAAFPMGLGRSPANVDAERVFQRYFGEYALLREAQKACHPSDKYRDEMDRLREENEALRAQLSNLTKD